MYTKPASFLIEPKSKKDGYKMYIFVIVMFVGDHSCTDMRDYVMPCLFYIFNHLLYFGPLLAHD